MILKCIFSFLLIISEIVLTVILVKKINLAQEKITQINEKIEQTGCCIIAACQKVRNIVHKANKVAAFLKSKKLMQISRILKTTLNIIQFLIFVKTTDFKGLKTINFKNLRKLLYTQIAKNYILKIIKFAFS